MSHFDEKKRNILHSQGARARRDARRVGHSLSLALNEEEYERLLAQYEKLMERWRSLERRTRGDRFEDRSGEQIRLKPVFDDEYVRQTHGLIRLNEQVRGENDPYRKRKLYEEIDKKKYERWKMSRFVDRVTGEPVKVTVCDDGRVKFELQEAAV